MLGITALVVVRSCVLINASGENSDEVWKLVGRGDVPWGALNIAYRHHQVFRGVAWQCWVVGLGTTEKDIRRDVSRVQAGMCHWSLFWMMQPGGK
jgi:hypothetical protein